MNRMYGKLTLVGANWQVECEPHVTMFYKRVFTSMSRQYGTLTIGHTATNTETLEWLLLRYPLEISEEDRHIMNVTTRRARDKREELEKIVSGTLSIPVSTKIPLRDYQVQGVSLLKHQQAYLCGDDLGLGKTSIGLGGLAIGLLPAVVVCQTHLQRQWQNEAFKFLEGVKPHIVKTGKYYNPPAHNFLIITYSKLSKWAEYLADYKLVIFDEAQELRRDESAKNAAARRICSLIPNRLGLTATPVYNYGDEIFNIMDLLVPGCLGTKEEFLREWCTFSGRHWRVNDPQALGSYLRENHLFLRRRRHEVGRELPAVIRISEEVEYNDEALLANEDHALQLAREILHGSWNERGKAALELNAMMRVQTGIAKAPFVADFVKDLVESGESVVLCGWHREVYEVWQRKLEENGIKSVLYTGSESPKQKEDSVAEFLSGRAPVFIMSLRSGAGLNGLQMKSSMIVFGELDWSPQVHEQNIGRLNRDGQKDPVTAIFLYAGGGCDPVIAQVLGIKKNQSEGILNPDKKEDDFGVEASQDMEESGRAALLAKAILARKKSGKKCDRDSCDSAIVGDGQ